MIPTSPEPMTIEQLKAHMDRRFDRLERTKADRSELRRLAARVDRCATKADLERFATKQYLKRFATKADWKRFATKADLKRFATKEDLKRFATKDDLQRVAARLEDRIIAMQTFVQRVVDHHDRILNDHEARLLDSERHA
jgi:hypothetical protein